MTKRLILIDAFAILFRSYFALPPMSAPDGRPTNAVFGFTRIILNVIDELEPDCIAIAYDSPGPTFRKDLYEEYKANRPEAPADFIPQIEISKQVVDVLNIPRFEFGGFEADDIIGSLAYQACQSKDFETVVVTGDQDMFQLVNDDNNVKVYIPGLRGRDSVLYDQTGVIEKMSVTAEQIIDYKALAGDSSDNIPGIKGIGPKTAIQLLKDYGNLDKLYQTLLSQVKLDPETKTIINTKDELKQILANLNLKPAILSKLVAGQEMAYLSRQLATISNQVDITLEMDLCKLNAYDKQQVRGLFEELRFKSLMNRLPDDQFETDVQEALF